MEEEINLRELLQTLKKRIVLIIAIAVSAAVIGAVVSYYFITPSYQAITTILVNESKNTQSVVTSEATVADQTVMATYYKIIQSEAILSKAGKKLKPKMTASQLKAMITVGGDGKDQVINLTVQDTDPVRAAKIANTTASVFEKEVVNLMNVDNVSILDKAKETGSFAPVAPNPQLNIAIALIVGLMIGVGIAFLLEYFDNTIKREEEIGRLLNIPVLGVISTIEEPKQGVETQVKGTSIRV
jgi:capsular polysaccharide biosynthesis protein